MYDKHYVAKMILEAWDSAVRDFREGYGHLQYQDWLVFDRHGIADPWQVAEGM